MFPSTAFVLRAVALLFFTTFTAARSIQISKRPIHSGGGGVPVVNTTILANNNEHSIQYDLYSIVIFSDNIPLPALTER
jgi:hypothetical protein